MFERLRKSNMPIAVDLGAQSVKVVQCVGSGRIGAYASRPLPAGLTVDDADYHEVTAGLVGEMLRGGGFRGRHVVSVLPSAAVRFTNLRLPLMPVEELASTVAWEAKDRLAEGIEEAQVQYLNAGEVREGGNRRLELIVLSAAGAFVEGHIAALSKQGLEIDAIEAAVTALGRWYDTELGSEASAKVVIDLGWGSTKVMVLEGGVVRFFKLIDLGGKTLSGASGAGHGAGEAVGGGELIGRLASEIMLCLRYYGVTFRQQRPSEATVVGGGACDAALVAALSQETGIELSVAGESGMLPGPGWAAGAGAGLRCVRRQASKEAA